MLKRGAADRYGFIGRPSWVSRAIGACALLFALGGAVGRAEAATEVVLYPSDFTTIRGNWAVATASGTASGKQLSSTDSGWASTSSPLASPGHYVEATFSAASGTSYRVWVRLRATSNSKYNDSLWVQFSDALTSTGSAVHRIGSTGGLLVNLENCDGCGVAGWGWQDSAYWLEQVNVVRFAASGTHTIRLQTREDGLQIDEVVLSPATYLYAAPGQVTNDATIVPKTTTSAVTGSPAYGGTPAALPAQIYAHTFDTGAKGVSYYDTTAGNTGGKARTTDVDIESSSEGGYNVGWTAAGEWLNYSVNVATAGAYSVQLRVASSGGAKMHVGFNGPSSVWSAVSIPSTGGWQTWTTVTLPVTLGAGNQLMTIAFDAGGANLRFINVVKTTTTSTPAPPPPPPPSGSELIVATWNIKNVTSEAHARRAIDYMAALSPQPQVIVFVEAYGAMMNVYLDELRNRTPYTWRGTFQPHCPAGKLSGGSCTVTDNEGVVVLSWLPVVSSGGKLLPYADSWKSARGVARLAVTFNSTTVQVFGLHLPQGNVSARNGAMSYFKNWAGGYSKPQLAGGDFNADPDQIDSTSGMRPNFIDSWSVVGSGLGRTCTTPSPTMKLDYWFMDNSGKATPNWSSVVLATGTISDHYPVHTSFAIRP